MLNPDYKNIIINKLKPYEPISIGIFGSYARGEQRADSDLDVLFQYGKVPGLLEWVGLQQDLSDELGVKVDLVSYYALKNERLKGYIFKDLIRII